MSSLSKEAREKKAKARKERWEQGETGFQKAALFIKKNLPIGDKGLISKPLTKFAQTTEERQLGHSKTSRKSPAAAAGISAKKRGELMRKNQLRKSDPAAYKKEKEEWTKAQAAKRKKVATDRHAQFKADKAVKGKGNKSYNKGKPKSEWVDSAYERRQADAKAAMQAEARKRHAAWKAAQQAKREAKKNKK